MACCRKDLFVFFGGGGFFDKIEPLTYSTRLSQVRNEVVFWDRIVRRKEDSVITVSDKNKYAFREMSARFKYVHVRFSRRASMLRYPRDRCLPTRAAAEALHLPITP